MGMALEGGTIVVNEDETEESDVEPVADGAICEHAFDLVISIEGTRGITKEQFVRGKTLAATLIKTVAATPGMRAGVVVAGKAPVVATEITTNLEAAAKAAITVAFPRAPKNTFEGAMGGADMFVRSAERDVHAAAAGGGIAGAP